MLKLSLQKVWKLSSAALLQASNRKWYWHLCFESAAFSKEKRGMSLFQDRQENKTCLRNPKYSWRYSEQKSIGNKKRASAEIRKNKILSVLQKWKTSFPVQPADIYKNLPKKRNRNRNQIRKIHRRLWLELLKSQKFYQKKQTVLVGKTKCFTGKNKLF